jgi:hypothetical protein
MADMPDDDRMPGYLGASWRKVRRCLQAREPVERTADAISVALAGTLRATHGVPRLAGIAARMQEVAFAGAPAQSRVPGSDEARRHVPTDIAERAAGCLAATMPEVLALVSPEEASLLLAKRLLADLAYHYGLDRIAPLLVAEGEYDPGELQSFFDEVLASEQVSKLAKRLLDRPNGKGLRAPRRRRFKMPLKDLLETDLAEVQ